MMESKLSTSGYIVLFAVAFGAIYYGVYGLLVLAALKFMPQVSVAIADNIAPAWAVTFAGEIVGKLDLLIALVLANMAATYLVFITVYNAKKEVNK